MTSRRLPLLAMVSDNESDDDAKELQHLKRRVKRLHKEEDEIRLQFEQYKLRRASRRRKREAAAKHLASNPKDIIEGITESLYGGGISINLEGEKENPVAPKLPEAKAKASVSVIYIDM